jgi:hypothetical protein
LAVGEGRPTPPQTRVPHLRDSSIVAKVGFPLLPPPPPVILKRSEEFPHFAFTPAHLLPPLPPPQTRVPHLRDGSIVAKVGFRR